MRHAPRLNLSCIKMNVTRKSVNHVPWLNHSCYEGIANHVSEFIIRATRCTLRGNHKSPIEVESFVQQVAHYEGIVNRIPRLNHSCIEMHTTRESWIAYRGWIFRASRCTLRGNRESRIEVESFVQQDARYEGIVNYVPWLIHSCNKLHATGESWITYRGWFIRATSCTLRGVKDARYGHCIKRYRYK